MTRFQPPGDLDCDLVFRFFWLFSCFECSLKRNGYLGSDRFGNAKANWKAFVRDVAEPLAGVGEPRCVAARHYLISNAPMRQVVREGRLTWERQRKKRGQSDEEFALSMLQLVRNNLFHGGKYPDGPINEVERNRQLIEASVDLLEACLNLRPNLRADMAYAA